LACFRMSFTLSLPVIKPRTISLKCFVASGAVRREEPKELFAPRRRFLASLTSFPWCLEADCYMRLPRDTCENLRGLTAS
jgi:hypothetical protein